MPEHWIQWTGPLSCHAWTSDRQKGQLLGALSFVHGTSPVGVSLGLQDQPPEPPTAPRERGEGETHSGCRPLGPSARFQDVGHKQRGRLSAERERRGIPESTSRRKRAGPAPDAAGGWSPTLPPALRRIDPTENPRSRHLPSTSPTPAQRKSPGEEERAQGIPRAPLPPGGPGDRRSGKRAGPRPGRHLKSAPASASGGKNPTRGFGHGQGLGCQPTPSFLTATTSK